MRKKDYFTICPLYEGGKCPSCYEHSDNEEYLRKIDNKCCESHREPTKEELKLMYKKRRNKYDN